MRVYGVDLAAWIRDERVVGLLDLIDMLPEDSLLNEAITNDPEAAALLAEQYLASRGEGEADESAGAPRVSQYGLTNKQLGDLLNEMKQVKQAIIASAGGKPKAEKPALTPRTGIEKAIAAAERKWAEDFIQQFGFSPDDI